MLDAYLGTDAGPVLARLQREGYVRPASLPPEPGARRWELTEAGRQRLEAPDA